jgi:hypothetical protein
MVKMTPEFPYGNFPTRECPPPPAVGDHKFGPCADFCERFPWMLPNNGDDDDA